jgi:ketosteroid isomerase-like protein/predicted ester cyclase
MKTHGNILCAFGWVLGACSSETVGPPPSAPVNWQSLQPHPVIDAGPDIVTAKERALPAAYATALAAPGLAPLGPLLDDEVHFVSPGMDDVHGRDAVVRAHDALFGAFDDRKISTDRVWRTPNEQTIEWTMTGTQARDWMKVSATHKPVAFRGLSLLWTTDNGSITDVHVYVDVAIVKAQLGVGPKELLMQPPAQPPAGPTQVYEQAQTGPSGDKSHVAAVQSWLDALENNNEAGYLGAVTDDVEVHTSERPQPLRGKEEAKAYYRATRRAIGQLDTTVENGWGVAPFVVVEYSIAGEQLGPIGWVPAQRDKVDRLEVVDICELADGKIARVWRYDNPAQILGGSTP